MNRHSRRLYQSEGKFCPHSFYLPSLTAQTPMNKGTEGKSEGSEGYIKKIVLVLSLP